MIVWAIWVGAVQPLEVRIQRADRFEVQATILATSLACARAFIPTGLRCDEAIPGNEAGLIETWVPAPPAKEAA